MFAKKCFLKIFCYFEKYFEENLYNYLKRSSIVIKNNYLIATNFYRKSMLDESGLCYDNFDTSMWGNFECFNLIIYA